MMLDELYQELILQHAKESTHRGSLGDDADNEVEVCNPLCGDSLSLTIQVRGGDVLKVRFDGEGCAISQSAASMLAELVEGKSFEEIDEIVEKFRSMLRDSSDEGDEEALGDLVVLKGVKQFPIRAKCALLAFEGLQKALAPLREAPSLVSPPLLSVKESAQV